MNKIILYALLGMFAFVLLSNTAVSTSWDPEAREIPFQVNHSDRIVIGTVKELRPSFEYTDIIISVDEWLKDPLSRNEITVRTERGTNAFTVGAANFTVGEKTLLMLKDVDAEKGKFSMPFMELGKRPVSDRNEVIVVVDKLLSPVATTPIITMNGTFQIITVPCVFNAQCNPMYVLIDKDGNEHHLLFSSGTRLPYRGQLIEVTGIEIYDTDSKCWLNDKKVPCQPIGRVNVSSWQPLLYDAQGSASATGVSIEEALRRFQLQDIAGKLEAELSNNETETFAGLLVEHTPEFRVVVAFTRDGEETIKPYLKQHAELANIVDVRIAKVSLANLQRDQADASSSASASGIPVQSGIDVSENSVKLYVAKADRSRFDDALQRREIRLPDTVRVITVEALAEEYRDASSSPTAQTSPKAPGFESILAILLLVSMVYIMRRRN